MSDAQLSDNETISELPAEAATFVSWAFWTQIEIKTNIILAGIFILLVTLHQAFKCLKFLCPKPTSLERNLSLATSIDDQVFLTRFYSFQKRYIVIYVLIFAVDIIAAPYVHYMYSKYHKLPDQRTIELLQVAFLSTALSSCIIPSVIDMLGRRLGIAACMLAYCSRYIIVAFFSRPSSFIAAQILYGVGVSLLYSVPESWMVDQHRILGFPDMLLQDTYTKQNLITSVLLIALCQCTAWLRLYFGLTVVLCMAASLALFNILLLFLLWEENTGHGEPERREEYDPSLAMRLLGLLVTSIVHIFSEFQIFAIGIAYCLLESAIWIFTFFWTPRIQPLEPDAIFPGLMLAYGMGAYTFSIISNSLDSPDLNRGGLVKTTEEPKAPESSTEWQIAEEMTVETVVNFQQSSLKITRILANLMNNGIPLRLMVLLYQLLSAIVFFVLSRGTSLTSALIMILIIEFCMGCHYSAFSNLKSQIVPHKGRVITYSLFSVPSSIFNYIVIGRYAEWNISGIFFMACEYCAIAFFFTLIAWLLRAFRRRRRPRWHPENPGIASSSSVHQSRWPFRKSSQSNRNSKVTDQEDSGVTTAFTAASLFFRRGAPPEKTSKHIAVVVSEETTPLPVDSRIDYN